MENGIDNTFLSQVREEMYAKKMKEDDYQSEAVHNSLLRRPEKSHTEAKTDLREYYRKQQIISELRSSVSEIAMNTISNNSLELIDNTIYSMLEEIGCNTGLYVHDTDNLYGDADGARKLLLEDCEMLQEPISREDRFT